MEHENGLINYLNPTGKVMATHMNAVTTSCGIDVNFERHSCVHIFVLSCHIKAFRNADLTVHLYPPNTLSPSTSFPLPNNLTSPHTLPSLHSSLPTQTLPPPHRHSPSHSVHPSPPPSPSLPPPPDGHDGGRVPRSKALRSCQKRARIASRETSERLSAGKWRKFFGVMPSNLVLFVLSLLRSSRYLKWSLQIHFSKKLYRKKIKPQKNIQGLKVVSSIHPFIHHDLSMR